MGGRRRGHCHLAFLRRWRIHDALATTTQCNSPNNGHPITTAHGYPTAWCHDGPATHDGPTTNDGTAAAYDATTGSATHDAATATNDGSTTTTHAAAVRAVAKPTNCHDTATTNVRPNESEPSCFQGHCERLTLG